MLHAKSGKLQCHKCQNIIWLRWLLSRRSAKNNQEMRRTTTAFAIPRNGTVITTAAAAAAVSWNDNFVSRDYFHLSRICKRHIKEKDCVCHCFKMLLRHSDVL